MGYKQIDGNKNILIHENGKVREGLRNLPEDSDRFVYSRDKKGNVKKSVWPKLIVASDIDGREDIRLLPEVVLKHHGKLPEKVECSPTDFEAKDDDKTNCALENIEYVGDASFSKKAPYKGKPEDEKEGDVPEEPEAEAEEAPEETEEAEEAPEEPTVKKSKDMNASEAASFIKQYDFSELEDMDFLSEDEDRVTVTEAWESARKKFEDSLE